jgi:N-succinyl-L-ornithine transcarbamylase
MQHFISVHDADNIDTLVQQALSFKQNPYQLQHIGHNKKVGLIFLNPSLRTRMSTQIAAQNLGMEAIVFNMDKEGWALEFEDGAIMNGNTVEHIKEAAPILGQYFDVLCIRTFPLLQDSTIDYKEHIIHQFKQYAGVPIVSLESATLHPLQSLADVITIQEYLPLPQKPKVVLTWAPHVKPLPQCVANSFAQWITTWNKTDFVIAHPKGLDLNTAYTNGASISHNQEEAIANADFIYVKNWSSYNHYGKLHIDDKDWMLTIDKLNRAKQAKVMHCLPVRRNIELHASILDSKHSIVQQQAGNRIWAAQAVLHKIITP